MIYSMTGFGQGKCKTALGSYACEIKTVNNRFLEVQCRLPRILGVAETQIRSYVSDHIKRGSVFINIYSEEGQSNENGALKVDLKSVKNYVRMLQEVKKACKISGEVTIETVASFPGLISKETVQVSEKEAWNICKKLLDISLGKLIQMRGGEGEKLSKAINGHLNECKKALEKIQERIPARLLEYRGRLEKNITELVGKVEVDKNRIATEIALMSERLDISEECERLTIHMGQFNDTLSKNSEAGKRLNFLLQEMNREANTICSKANDAEITSQSIFLKEKIEVIREQVQNLE